MRALKFKRLDQTTNNIRRIPPSLQRPKSPCLSGSNWRDVLPRKGESKSVTHAANLHRTHSPPYDSVMNVHTHRLYDRRRVHLESSKLSLFTEGEYNHKLQNLPSITLQCGKGASEPVSRILSPESRDGDHSSSPDIAVGVERPTRELPLLAQPSTVAPAPI
jgi:hypothetical protein